MQKRSILVPVFLIFLIAAFVIYFFFQTPNPVEQGIRGIFELVTLPFQKITYLSFHLASQKDTQKEKLLDSLSTIVHEKDLQKENQALHDQFATSSIDSQKLLPAQIVGERGLVPGVSLPDEIIIDKGSSEGIKNGETVIYKNNLVGKIVTIEQHHSLVQLPSYKGVTLTATTLKTNAVGIIQGQGADGMLLENVVLSDNLENQDLVATKGDTDINSGGYPPNLVIGKITSVNRQTSALFQAASVKSLLDISRMSYVFVMIGNL